MKINSEPTLMVPFHSTLYQYHIHSQPDTNTVYAASILFQDLPNKIGWQLMIIDKNRWESMTIDIINSNYEDLN